MEETEKFVGCLTCDMRVYLRDDLLRQVYVLPY